MEYFSYAASVFVLHKTKVVMSASGSGCAKRVSIVCFEVFEASLLTSGFGILLR